MVGKYVRKTNRQQWDENAMQRAIRAVKDGEMGWLKASRTFNVPFTTLRRRAADVNKRVKNVSKGLGRFSTTFSPEQEKQILEHIKGLERRLFGITQKDLCVLVFDWAEANKIQHRFNKIKKRAGWDWIKGFRRRHPEITLRRPENTSIARAMAFNKPNIAKFFESYQDLLEEHKFPPERMYNVDETGISTVQNPPKVFAATGKKQVGTIAGAERGIHVTVVCCTNPIGSYIPPTFIFPRKNWKQELLEGAPTGSLGLPQESGWMTSELFLAWLKHFKKYSNPSLESPVLLIMDGHVSHKSYGALKYAKENGIVLLCLPAHCSHRMQPLDVSFFAPLKAYLNQELTKKIRQNEGRAISQLQIAGIFRPAYEKAATVANAVSGFKNTGLWPVDPFVFPDHLFEPSTVTDQEAHPTVADDRVMPIDKTTNIKEIPIQPSKEPNVEQTKNDTTVIPLTSFSPLPSTSGLTSRKNRKKDPAVLTSTPHMLEVKEREIAKAEKSRRKSARKVKTRLSIDPDDAFEEEPTFNEAFGSKIYDDEDDAYCLFCCEKFSHSKGGEKWIRCDKCKQWAHIFCAGVTFKTKTYVCDACL